jgi:hypothetical protein
LRAPAPRCRPMPQTPRPAVIRPRDGVRPSGPAGQRLRPTAPRPHLLVDQLLEQADKAAGRARQRRLAVAEVDHVTAELLRRDERAHQRRARLHRPQAAGTCPPTHTNTNKAAQDAGLPPDDESDGCAWPTKARVQCPAAAGDLAPVRVRVPIANLERHQLAPRGDTVELGLVGPVCADDAASGVQQRVRHGKTLCGEAAYPATWLPWLPPLVTSEHTVPSP